MVENIHKARQAINKKKAHDYADVDVLSNFKRVSLAASALKIDVAKPWGYALFMVLMKIDRYNNLLSAGKKPKNESIDDTIIDAHNYLDLSHAAYKDMVTLIKRSL
jgi:hypothetical protein